MQANNLSFSGGRIWIRRFHTFRQAKKLGAFTILGFVDIHFYGADIDGFLFTSNFQPIPPQARYSYPGRVGYKQVMKLSSQDNQELRELIRSAWFKKYR